MIEDEEEEDEEEEEGTDVCDVHDMLILHTRQRKNSNNNNKTGGIEVRVWGVDSECEDMRVESVCVGACV